MTTGLLVAGGGFAFATTDSHWSLVPIADPKPPTVESVDWAQSPIDQFVLTRLEDAGLSPAEPADKRTLLRRVTFSLTGLPPTPQQIKSFVADESTDAFAKVVDRLLASPAYGERWGRHWLDVARYADCNGGDESKPFPNAFRYRNYVVDAFNRDLPFDVFVRHQIAGDLLDPAAVEHRGLHPLTGTGILVLGTKIVAEKDAPKMVADIVDEQIETFGRAFMGLSLGCARCHDHKFDPVSTKDYYALAGIFHSTRTMASTGNWLERKIDSQPDAVKVMAVEEGKIRNVRVHLRGNHLELGEEVSRRFLETIAGVNQATLPANQSGRLQLAEWLTSPEHPLTARVIVNRVWRWHFGHGLVRTPNNFGVRGELPSHPKLLDYLATQFMRDSWSIKELHRRILASNTYQMSSRNDPAAAGADPGNRLLWRFNRQRLEAEAIRDSVLAVAGQLDHEIGGAPLSLKTYNMSPADLEANRKFYENSNRRSIYLPVLRTNVYEFLTLFDFPNPDFASGHRFATTVPTQALLMLNSEMYELRARQAAARVLSDESLTTDDSRLHHAYLLFFGRPPEPAETNRATMFLAAYRATSKEVSEEHAWAALCQTFFASNEFVHLN